MSSPLAEQARQLFRTAYRNEPTVCAFAPGRIEFIGNHTDYNGGPVLGAAINRGVAVALRLRDDGRKRFCSAIADEIVEETAPKPVPRQGAGSWINYPLGVWHALPAFKFTAPTGFEIAVTSDLPSGAGLSSSAALELATALALLSASGQAVDNATLAAIGRKAENDFVGVPCGILDQGTSAFGRANQLVHIDCRGPFYSNVPLPAGVRLWIFNTHTKHSLVDSLYATRHRECHDAARQLGVERLADLTPEQLEELSGRLDAVLLRRARHIVGECDRVKQVTHACATGDLHAIGRLLQQSHASSRENFENSTPELDLLAETLAQHPRVFGARLTGGGFGGAVMALASSDFSADDARTIADHYVARFNHIPATLQCEVGNGAALADAREERDREGEIASG